MKEPVTYQAILEEGRVKGEAQASRRILLALGTKRLGSPSAQARAIIDAIDSVQRLEQMATRVTDVTSWEELLAS